MSIGLNPKMMRTFIPGLLLALTIGAVMSLFNPVRPGFYQPARPSLMGAKRHLALFFSDEKRLLKELSETQNQLNITIDLLSKAQNQLSSRQQLALLKLRGQLHRLDDIPRTSETTPEALDRSYHELAAKLSTLIDGLDQT
jgi:hypothetical protein